MRILLISHTCQSTSEGQPEGPAAWRAARRRVVPAELRPAGSITADGEGPRILPTPPFGWKSPRWPARGWVPRRRTSTGIPVWRGCSKSSVPDIIDLWEEPWGLVSAHTCWLRNQLLPKQRSSPRPSRTSKRRSPSLLKPSGATRCATRSMPSPEMRRQYRCFATRAIAGRSDRAEWCGRAALSPYGQSGVPARSGLQRVHRRLRRAHGRGEGLEDLIDALAFCPEFVRLVFVGTGRMTPHLERRAKSSVVPRRSEILPGRPLEQLPEIMNALDVLALPARTTHRWKEQFGRVISRRTPAGHRSSAPTPAPSPKSSAAAAGSFRSKSRSARRRAPGVRPLA